MSWVLVLYIYAGSFAKGDSVTLATVPGELRQRAALRLFEAFYLKTTGEVDMGTGTFDPGKYRAYASATAAKPTTGPTGVFTATGMKPSLNPKGVKLRESRDSADNPEATPIIVATDVTGSMGELAGIIARKGLGVLFESILARKPVTNPHMMFMAIGDVHCDQAPLQVSQFEADNRIVEQLADTYVESGGGGNGWESYELPWYFAANHTEHDSLIKRGKRGYLFTVGDEPIGPGLKKSELVKFLDDGAERDFSTRECLEAAQRLYDVYHIIIRAGYAASAMDTVKDTWKPLLGQHLIVLDDYTALAETIVTTIEVAEGRDAAISAAGWGASAATVLAATQSLPKGSSQRLLGSLGT